ncbi:hypothetical protein E2562_033580 [Oryza meyeriana var. granulata]|uniref:Uncharacterized protein n=1 Tax=Oryza meyeriana var. granulata TaxID=110450 RepID=A0A6G1F130_9ORYZ|nr:hypothetical protein E2562_033580 [Oryza meyeriana var. granulata]
MRYLPGCFQDSGGSFHGHHHHYRLRDGDEFYHRSRRQLVYTHASTGLRLVTARDNAGYHTRLPKDHCTCGPVPARDSVCPELVLGAGIGVDSEGDLFDPSQHCTTYYLYHSSCDYSYVCLCTDDDHLCPCGALFSKPDHHDSTRWALLCGDLG